MEKRREHRIPAIKALSYSDDRYAFGDMIATTTVDMSASGASLYTLRPFHAGENMAVFSPVLGNVLRHAKVCWSRQISGNIYQVGISFN